MGYNVTLIGQEELEARIKKMANARQVFDADFRKAAIWSNSTLKKTTPRKTGTTGRSWVGPIKLNDSSYEIENRETTTDGKHSIPVILDKGRSAVFPKNKYLYIPLSERARAKRAGAHIPKSWIRGIPGSVSSGDDYILVRSVKATPGTKFMTNAINQASRDLTSAMIGTIRSIHSGS